MWRGWRGSNPRPLASEANTLSTELQPQTPISSKPFNYRMDQDAQGSVRTQLKAQALEISVHRGPPHL